MTLSVQSLPAPAVNDNFGDDDNILINGDCTIAQAGNSFAGIAAGQTAYPIDMFRLNNQTGTAVLTASQANDHPILGAQGHSFKATVTTADAVVAAGDFVAINLSIEGNQLAKIFRDSVTDYCPLVLSFWAKHNLGVAAILGFGFASSNGDRIFPSYVNFGADGLWHYIAVPIISAGFSAGGAWNIAPPNTNSAGSVTFALMAGSNVTNGTPDQWNNNTAFANLFATGLATNFCATVGNTLQLADVKLQRGVIGTVYRRKSFPLQLAECQRYYWQTFPYGTVPAQNAGFLNAGLISYYSQRAGVANYRISVPHPMEMRTTPIVTTFNPAAANANWRNASIPADSGVPVTQSNTKNAVIDNPQVAGDAVNQIIAIHATYNARL